MIVANEERLEVAGKVYLYALTSMAVDDEEDMQYTTYGMQATDERQNIVAVYPDISTNREFVQKIVDKCNHNQVDVLHLEDIIIDSLG